MYVGVSLWVGSSGARQHRPPTPIAYVQWLWALDFMIQKNTLARPAIPSHTSPRNFSRSGAQPIMVVAVGYLLAVLSSVFNGSFVAFAKLQSVASVDLHPILFNFYVTCGVAASSCLAIPWVLAGHGELRFVYEGAIGGFLFVGASSLSFVAAKNLGLSTGQGVWSGSAITVAFLWGVLGPHPIGQPLGSLPLSLLAMLLLLMGVAGMVKCQPLGRALDWRGGKSLLDTEHPLHGGSSSDSDVGSGSGVRENGSLTEDCALQPRTAHIAKSARVTGLCAAVGVGLFGGSILVPLAYLEDQVWLALGLG